MKASAWQKTFSPFTRAYRKKVTIKDDVLSSFESWIQIDKPLTYTLINQALHGKSEIGYFSSLKTKIIGIDIDDHKNRAWTRNHPSMQLLDKYNNIVARLGFYPSIVFKSPRGLHAFYLFEYHSLHEIFELRLRERLQGCSFEVLPTPNSSLRIDPLKNCIHPETFKKLDLEKHEIKIYQPYDLLSCSVTAESIRNTEKLETRKQARRVFNESRLEKLEKSLLPINPGESNEKIFKSAIMPAYYKSFSGNIDEAVKRIQNCLLFPSGYSGELNNEKRLRERVSSSFRKLSRNWIDYVGSERKEINLSLFDLQIIEQLTKQHPFSKQRTKPIKEFLTKLFEWTSYQDEIRKNPKERVFWSWYYKNYDFHRKQGFYPIPSALMQSWNKRYVEITDWLKTINIISKQTEYTFNPDSRYNSVCRYFSVNRIYEQRRTFGIDFLSELKTSGLKQSQIASILGVSRTTVNLWLTGKKDISKTNLIHYQNLWSNYIQGTGGAHPQ